MMIFFFFFFFFGGGGVGLWLYVQVKKKFNHVGTFPWLNQYLAMKMKCLAQGHNTAPLVRSSNPRPCNQGSDTLPTEHGAPFGMMKRVGSGIVLHV